MNTSDTIASCDPALHNGQRAVADYYVREAVASLTFNNVDYTPVAMGLTFACCRDHVDHALHHVFAQGARFAIVRREETL